MNTYWRGLFSEYYVAFYLVCRGFKIIKHRYKTRVGEIDIIARKDNLICFFEIKNHRYFIQESIRPRQMLRIRRAAEVFLSKSRRDHESVVRFYAAFVRGWRIILIEDDFLR